METRIQSSSSSVLKLPQCFQTNRAITATYENYIQVLMDSSLEIQFSPQILEVQSKDNAHTIQNHQQDYKKWN